MKGKKAMWKLTEEEDQYIVEMYNKMPAENRLKASVAVLDKMVAEKEDDVLHFLDHS